MLNLVQSLNLQEQIQYPTRNDTSISLSSRRKTRATRGAPHLELGLLQHRRIAGVAHVDHDWRFEQQTENYLGAREGGKGRKAEDLQRGSRVANLSDRLPQRRRRPSELGRRGAKMRIQEGVLGDAIPK